MDSRCLSKAKTEKKNSYMFENGNKEKKVDF